MKLIHGGDWAGFETEYGKAPLDLSANLSPLGMPEGVKAAAAFVMVDRRERGQTEKAATREVQETYGFPVYSIADVFDILEYLEEKPENREKAARIRAYLAEYGDKA